MINLDNFCDYPFAMETENGEIISLTSDFQNRIRLRILEKCNARESDLADYLTRRDNKEKPTSTAFELLDFTGIDALISVLGFEPDTQRFQCKGFGFLCSGDGWETKDLLQKLNFVLSEKIEYGPHGFGTHGVVYVSKRIRIQKS